MSGRLQSFEGARVFDGKKMHESMAVLVEGSVVKALVARGDVPQEAQRMDLKGGILAPGFVDLQVNGGGGVMLNSAPTVEALKVMEAAHAGLGATTILPTLITDTKEHTKAAIEAVKGAIEAGIEGIAGLHLEGPHLSIARKGAHDPALIRPMEDKDLSLLVEAAKALPVLKVTLAPESASLAQIRALKKAGVVVALGHTDAPFADCVAALDAGASLVTHLFNAMSQLTNREPGLVGAAISHPRAAAGLIADGIHVHPASLRTAWRAKQGAEALYLVSDAMATAGSKINHFILNGRKICRNGARLTLEDGTLAGAHLDLATAIAFMTRDVGVPESEALAMATACPARLAGLGDRGRIAPKARADLVHLSDDLTLRAVWRSGQPHERASATSD